MADWLWSESQWKQNWTLSFLQERHPPVVIRVNDTEISSASSMNVLGITFDSKLTWAKHVAKQVSKSNKALQAIKMISKFFNSSEILMLLTSNFYSVLYNNSEVWYIPKLKPEINQLILSASVNALKLSKRCPNMYESFINIHKSCRRATPSENDQLQTCSFNPQTLQPGTA